MKPEAIEMNSRGLINCNESPHQQYYMPHYVSGKQNGVPMYYTQNSTLSRNNNIGVTFASSPTTPMMGLLPNNEQYFVNGTLNHCGQTIANSPMSSNLADDQKTFSGYETGSDDAAMTMKDVMRQQNFICESSEQQKWTTSSSAGETVISLIQNSPALIHMGRKPQSNVPYLVQGTGPIPCQIINKCNNSHSYYRDLKSISPNWDCLLNQNTLYNEDFLDQGYSSHLTLRDRLHNIEMASSPQKTKTQNQTLPSPIRSYRKSDLQTDDSFNDSVVSPQEAPKPSLERSKTICRTRNGFASNNSLVLKESLSIDSLESNLEGSDHTLQQTFDHSELLGRYSFNQESYSDTEDSYNLLEANSGLYLGRCKPAKQKTRLLDAILDLDQITLSHSDWLSSERPTSTLRNVPSLDHTRKFTEHSSTKSNHYFDDKDRSGKDSPISFEENYDPFSLVSIYSIEPGKYSHYEQDNTIRATTRHPRRSTRSKEASEQPDIVEEYLRALEIDQSFLSPVEKKFVCSAKRALVKVSKSSHIVTRAQSLESGKKSCELQLDNGLLEEPDLEFDNPLHSSTFPYSLAEISKRQELILAMTSTTKIESSTNSPTIKKLNCVTSYPTPPFSSTVSSLKHQINTDINNKESERYRPTTSGKTLTIQRTPSSLSQNSLCGGGYNCPHNTAGTPSSITSQFWKYSTMPSSTPNGVSAMHTGVNSILQGREREKKDLQQLNERFANYIEKVRFLEAQNRKLVSELNQLKERWGKDTERVKTMYSVELEQLRRLLSLAEKSKAQIELKASTLEDQYTEAQNMAGEAQKHSIAHKETINKLNQQVSDYEGELALLKRRISSLLEDRNRDKSEIKRLREESKKLRQDLDGETMAHITAENEAQSMKDEIAFVKQVHESELKELSALAYRDTTQENRDFWKNEMAQALRDIQSEYDSKLDTLKSDLDGFYNIKVQELRNNTVRGGLEIGQLRDDNARIKNQLVELRKRLPDLEARNAQLERQLNDARQDLDDHVRENELERNILKKELGTAQQDLERTLVEFHALLDAKLSLELEIAAYRKLLENEENRYGTRYQPPIITNKVETATSKTTYTRSAKGNVSISDCSVDGKYITLENNGKKREDISNMKIIRYMDHEKTGVSFILPGNTIMEPEGRGKSIKIWARGLKPNNAAPIDLETNDSSWGTGSYVRTVLLNSDGEERASHTQRTVIPG